MLLVHSLQGAKQIRDVLSAHLRLVNVTHKHFLQILVGGCGIGLRLACLVIGILLLLNSSF